MSTVVERLVESWLDSQSERRYQPAFIQMLVSEGWRVLHNTRHSPIELGKDVIARSPTGELFAFQLKGNPGSRLTKSQAQGIGAQIIELIDVPVPSLYREGAERHVSVLVTNGEIDEEAQVLLRALGERADNPLSPSSRFTVWARGDLLSRFIARASDIWPASLEGTRKLLELYSTDGESNVDPLEIADVLTLSAGRPASRMSAPERTAKLTSILLVGEILKGSWYRAENHYALFEASVLVFVFALRYADTTQRKRILAEYAPTITMHCADLLAEAESRGFEPDKIWGDRDMLSEVDVMAERGRLIANCAATLALSGEHSADFSRPYAKRLLAESFGHGLLWGQAAVPPALLRYWGYRLLDATQGPDRIIGSILVGLLGAAKSKVPGRDGIPDPYHGFEACWARAAGQDLGEDTVLRTDTFKGRTWFAQALLFMIAKRNWKQSCKAIWRLYSKVIHEDADLDRSDFFDARLSRKGQAISHVLYSDTWENLVRSAVSAGEDSFLDRFRDFAWVIAAYVAIVPYRGWTPVLMWLDTNLARTWYSAEHLPTA